MTTSATIERKPSSTAAQPAIVYTQLRRALGLVGAILGAAGLVVEALHYGGMLEAEHVVIPALSLSYEHNWPTWYSACLLWTCALGLAVAAMGSRRGSPRLTSRWWGLATIFAYLCADEALELHELLGTVLEFDGLLFFSWVVPGAALTAVFAAAYFGFWRALPSTTRRGFAWAFALYVGGALGMELPLGAWVEHHGDDNGVYAALDWVEEMLEIVGLSVFLLAIVEHLGQASVRLGFVPRHGIGDDESRDIEARGP